VGKNIGHSTPEPNFAPESVLSWDGPPANEPRLLRAVPSIVYDLLSMSTFRLNKTRRHRTLGANVVPTGSSFSQWCEHLPVLATCCLVLKRLIFADRNSLGTAQSIVAATTILANACPTVCLSGDGQQSARLRSGPCDSIFAMTATTKPPYVTTWNTGSFSMSFSGRSSLAPRLSAIMVQG